MRRGFTLVELVMVIMILAIVAGGVTILVGRLPSSTSVSTSAGTVSQAVRALQLFRTTRDRFPTRLDLLLPDHTNAALANSLGPDVATGVDVTAAELSVIDITSITGIATALRNSGIREVIESPDIDKDKDPNSAQPQTIFDDVEPDNTTREISIVPGSTPQHIVVLGSSAISRLNLDSAETYVVFGLGNNCEAVGEVMVSAPVHSRQEDGAVIDRYSRFMPVFEVEDSTVRLVTVVTLENEDGVAVVTGVSDYVRSFYNDRNLE
ncbi:MAG: type II secretion system protein [Planctomycetota bacterium]